MAGWFGVVWLVDDPATVRQGVGAACREVVRSREWASPADLHCQDERVLSVGAAASNSHLLLHPFPHPPLSLHFSLWLLTLTTIWYSSAVARLPGCHSYPMPEVSQQDNPRRHSQITWIQLASHLCVFPAAIWFICFPAMQFCLNTNNPHITTT